MTTPNETDGAGPTPLTGETIPTAQEWCTFEENFALDADELANRAARALNLLTHNPGRISRARMVEAMRHLTVGLGDYLESREPYVESKPGKVLLADAVGDAENSQTISVREIRAALERARELSRKIREQMP